MESNQDRSNSGGISKYQLLKLLTDRSIIDYITGCWLWTGPKSSFGHGRLCIDKMDIRVHRLSMHIFHDFDLESELQVNHKLNCPNPNCWNPDHMNYLVIIYTSWENIEDVNYAEIKGVRTDEIE